MYCLSPLDVLRLGFVWIRCKFHAREVRLRELEDLEAEPIDKLALRVIRQQFFRASL